MAHRRLWDLRVVAFLAGARVLGTRLLAFDGCTAAATFTRPAAGVRGAQQAILGRRILALLGYTETREAVAMLLIRSCCNVHLCASVVGHVLKYNSWRRTSTSF